MTELARLIALQALYQAWIARWDVGPINDRKLRERFREIMAP